MTNDPRDRNCLHPACSEVRFITDDPSEAGTVYPRFSVRFVTSRMIIERQELFTPVFSEVRYTTNDHSEAGTVYPRFSVRFVT